MSMVIALTGNPNTGKTTLFNALTGASQKIGNWPGATVEEKESFLSLPAINRDIKVVDLPGIYSFTASSIDEQIATERLISRDLISVHRFPA